MLEPILLIEILFLSKPILLALPVIIPQYIKKNIKIKRRNINVFFNIFDILSLYSNFHLYYHNV